MAMLKKKHKTSKCIVFLATVIAFKELEHDTYCNVFSVREPPHSAPLSSGGRNNLIAKYRTRQYANVGLIYAQRES